MAQPRSNLSVVSGNALGVGALARALVGKPFAWRGRGPDAFDCWGLVRECLLRSGVANVPDYPSSERGAVNSATMLDAMGARGNAVLPAAGAWKKLRGPQAGAAVVLKMPLGGHWHVGYMLTADEFLHTTEQTGGAVVERISSPLWCNLIIGYYLWEPSASAPSRIRCPESI